MCTSWALCFFSQRRKMAVGFMSNPHPYQHLEAVQVQKRLGVRSPDVSIAHAECEDMDCLSDEQSHVKTKTGSEHFCSTIMKGLFKYLKKEQEVARDGLVFTLLLPVPAFVKGESFHRKEG